MFERQKSASTVREEQTWKGPRNLPTSKRKRKRTEVKRKRRLNRGKYSGQ